MTGTAHPEAVEPSDEACMAALQGGDDSTLSLLMERWELPVKGLLLRFGIPSPDVEDLAQETFVRLYQRRAQYRPGAPFRPWVLTIAANLARNRLRWRGRHPSESLEARVAATGQAPVDSAAVHPASALDAAALAATVRRAVDALPPPLREAVVCVELEEMSHAEAAEVLACTPKAVETRLYRARAALRQALNRLLPAGSGRHAHG
jgi:RNA polymerase sigma factor (sigma-70 family)